MEYKTYHQLKQMSRQDIYNIGVSDNSIDEHAQRIVSHLGIEYFTKSTLLEMLSVTHREWNNQ